MIAQALSFFVLVALVAGRSEERSTRSLEGVDPNTLSCDPDGNEFLLLPHFVDCNKFYMCMNGEEVEFMCSATMIFDFVLQRCNWETITECVLRLSTEDSEEEGSGLEGSGTPNSVAEPEKGYISEH